MSTAASLTLIPSSVTTPTFTPGTAVFTWAPEAAAGTKYQGTTADSFVKEVKLYLVGQPDTATASEPYKTMNDWYTANYNAIEKHNLT